MKKKHLRKYVQHADDCMEEIEKKMCHMESLLFFVSLGMEYFSQNGDCYEGKTIQAIKEYLTTLRNGEVSELKKQLEHLKTV